MGIILFIFLYFIGVNCLFYLNDVAFINSNCLEGVKSVTINYHRLGCFIIDGAREGLLFGHPHLRW